MDNLVSRERKVVSTTCQICGDADALRQEEGAEDDDEVNTIIYGWNLRAFHLNRLSYQPPLLAGTLFISFLDDQSKNPTSPTLAIDRPAAIRAMVDALIEEGLVAEEDRPAELAEIPRLLDWDPEDDEDDAQEETEHAGAGNDGADKSEDDGRSDTLKITPRDEADEGTYIPTENHRGSVEARNSDQGEDDNDRREGNGSNEAARFLRRD